RGGFVRLPQLPATDYTPPSYERLAAPPRGRTSLRHFTDAIIGAAAVSDAEHRERCSSRPLGESCPLHEVGRSHYRPRHSPPPLALPAPSPAAGTFGGPTYQAQPAAVQR